MESKCELHLILLVEGTEKTIARAAAHNMFSIITNKNTTSALATMSRVMISWYKMYLPSVIHHNPCVADFFQGHTGELNGEMAGTNTPELFKFFMEVLSNF